MFDLVAKYIPIIRYTVTQFSLKQTTDKNIDSIGGCIACQNDRNTSKSKDRINSFEQVNAHGNCYYINCLYFHISKQLSLF